MPDVLTPAQRSLNMSRIRGKDTKPELLVRRLLHKAGFRYRLHRANLPGKPDIVFASRHKVLFIHGCFWHRHDCPFGLVVPRTNAKFWHDKITGNVERDRRNRAALEAAGWRVFVIWECELEDPPVVLRRLTQFLNSEAPLDIRQEVEVTAVNQRYE